MAYKGALSLWIMLLFAQEVRSPSAITAITAIIAIIATIGLRAFIAIISYHSFIRFLHRAHLIRAAKTSVLFSWAPEQWCIALSVGL